MKPLFYAGLHLIGLIILLSLSSCQNYSEDPYWDPHTAQIGLFLLDSGSVEYGSPQKVGISFVSCHLFDSVRVTTNIGNYDTVFGVSMNACQDTVYIDIPFFAEGPCTAFVNATTKFVTMRNRTGFLPLVDVTGKNGIHFIAKPVPIITHSGRHDTLLYAIMVTGDVMLPATFAYTVDPPYNDRFFTMTTSPRQDTLRLLLNPDVAGTYTVNVTASASGMNTSVRSSVKTEIRLFDSFVPPMVTIPKNMTVGKTDTLMFAVDNIGRADKLTLALEGGGTASPLYQTAILADGLDSLAVTVTPQAADTFACGVIVSNGLLSDTIRYFVPILPAGGGDITGPSIVLAAEPDYTSRVAVPSGTLTFNITDGSGVGMVYWKLNGGDTATVPATSDGVYELSYLLSTYGVNRIEVYAYDKSIAENLDSLEAYLYYYSFPGCISLTGPDEEAYGVSVTPVFSWSGGEDADGDTVNYSVRYGVDPNGLYWETEPTRSMSVMLPATQQLASSTKYYWKVVATTVGEFPETVESGMHSFTTESMSATVTANPVSITVTEGKSANFTVKVAGDMPITYQWQRNGLDIIGANGATCTVSPVTAEDKDSRYRCIVRNVLGSDTCKEATLAVVLLPYYTVTFESNGGSTVAEQSVKSGSFAQIPDPPPIKANCVFDGWYTTTGLTRKFQFTTVAITSDRTLYARWLPLCRVTYDANGAESGSVPVDTAVYIYGQVVAVSGNTGYLSRNGYSFGGWNTDTSGIRKTLEPGDTFTIRVPACTLFVAWKTAD